MGITDVATEAFDVVRRDLGHQCLCHFGNWAGDPADAQSLIF